MHRSRERGTSEEEGKRKDGAEEEGKLGGGNSLSPGMPRKSVIRGIPLLISEKRGRNNGIKNTKMEGTRSR
jgi:hypothetical protein